MGYSTHYSLELSFTVAGKPVELTDNSPLNDVIIDLRASYEGAGYALDDEGGAADGCKWYEHTEQMKEFSKKHPAVLFTLHGEGEESGDVWNEYFLNGKAQVAKAEIQIAPFDPKKLS